MNDAGFGAVSLYHTLIDQIRENEFPASHQISRRILNLPIHQDAQEEDLHEMVDCLTGLVDRAPAVTRGAA